MLQIRGDDAIGTPIDRHIQYQIVALIPRERPIHKTDGHRLCNVLQQIQHQFNRIASLARLLKVLRSKRNIAILASQLVVQQ